MCFLIFIRRTMCFFHRNRLCRLLDCTTMLVNPVCHKVGIDDCHYFSRLFRAYMGVSPKSYREKHAPAPPP